MLDSYRLVSITSNTVFETFPWPQFPSLNTVNKVAKADRELWVLRRQLMARYNFSLRDLYRNRELPGVHPLRGAQETLDDAVRHAYAVPRTKNPLEFLQALNAEVSAKEMSGEPITGPGLAMLVKNRKAYVTDECIRMPTTSGRA
jgi:hypothetical protein